MISLQQMLHTDGDDTLSLALQANRSPSAQNNSFGQQ